jgi:regulator of sirC expression with transglutaminase-like and TPR domain
VPTEVPLLEELLAGRASHVELDEAALAIARIYDPEVDTSACLRTLDEWAEAIDARLSRGAGGAEYVTQANRFLFETLGLKGDADDYFHPRNSCLHTAIFGRRALPITLSVLYMEVARRLLRPVFGVALPGHFFARYNDGLISVYIDSFHQGQVLTQKQCADMVRVTVQTRSDRGALLFAPATKRQIVVRMLNNLRGAYLRRQEEAKAGEVGALLERSLPHGVPYEGL